MFSRLPVLFSSQFDDGEMDDASLALVAILDRLHSVSNLLALIVLLPCNIDTSFVCAY